MADTLYTTGPAHSGARVYGSPQVQTIAPRNVQLDTIYYCQGYDKNGNRIPPVSGGGLVSGTILNQCFVATPVKGGGLISGSHIAGVYYSAGGVKGGGLVKGKQWIGSPPSEWVWWTVPGAAIFDKDIQGDVSDRSGRAPMPFSGWIYAIKKLTGGAVVYGQNGICYMQEAGLRWGFKKIVGIGLKSKNSVCGTDDVHYFIDKEGILWEWPAGSAPQMKDYRNFLSSLGSATVMSYDERNKSVYITDGTYGFVYTSSGLGKCPSVLTGMGYKAGSFIVTATTVPTTDPFQITTDILDFGTRADKVITQVEVGTDVSVPLFVAIDYRWNKASSFITSPWVKTDYTGMAPVAVSGVEFRIKLKVTTWASFKPDYINVIGSILGVQGERNA